MGLTLNLPYMYLYRICTHLRADGQPVLGEQLVLLGVGALRRAALGPRGRRLLARQKNNEVGPDRYR